MMARFLLAIALAGGLAGGAAQAQDGVRSAGPDPAVVAAPSAVAASSAQADAALATTKNGVRSAGPDPATAPQSLTAGPAAGSLLQTIFALTLVLGLLGVLAWFMKRYGPKAVAGSAHVRLVGALNLGGRERIMVVEVGDQWIVVGASPGRVNALATMPRQEGAAEAALHPHQPSATSFSEWLKQTIDKRNAK